MKYRFEYNFTGWVTEQGWDVDEFECEAADRDEAEKRFLLYITGLTEFTMKEVEGKKIQDTEKMPKTLTFDELIGAMLESTIDTE